MNQGMNQGMGQGMGQSGNMMESLKSNMMTMLMINNMNGQKSGSSGSNNMFSMIYVFIATSVVDFLFKNAPFALNFFMKRYNDKIENIKKDLSSTTKDITDNKVKKKTASITVTINVNNPENILGQALLDFITNNKNTTHVSYVRESFILNQKDVINIDEEIFARMTQSTSTDQTGGQGSSSTNMNSGAGANGSQSSIVQIIEIYSFTKTTDQLRNFMDEIKQKYTINVKNKLGNKRYYFNMHQLHVPMDIDKRKDLSRLPPNFAFIMKHFQTNRKFSNLFGEDIETIRNRVNFFCKNRKWYDEKGIPYTLGLLLSGSPGTGKTSTIKCLANETNRHICNVNLNNDMTKTQLENLFFSENIVVLNPMTGQNETYCIPLDQRIYVLEDVDCQSDIVMERALKKGVNGEKDSSNDSPSRTDQKVLEHYEDKHKVDLSFLLNLLDGVLENPGRIVIMTSNFPDTLDSALIRPGRIDVIAKFRNCTNNTVIEMIEFFYDVKLSEEDRECILSLKEEIITPAELSKVMFENFSDHKESVDYLEKLSEKVVADEIKKAEELENKKVVEEAESSLIVIENDIQSWAKENEITNWAKETEKIMEKINSKCNDENILGKYEVANPMYLNTESVDRINEDIVYVFMTKVLKAYTTPECVQKKNKNYYKTLLSKKVFNEISYVDFIEGIAKKFTVVVAMKESLEGIINKHQNNKDGGGNNEGTLYNIMTNSYTDEIHQYFTNDRMESLQLIHTLIKDGVIQGAVPEDLLPKSTQPICAGTRINEDTLFVFMTKALKRYGNMANVKKKDANYYKSLLTTNVFCEQMYITHVEKIVKTFPDIIGMENPLPLEEVNKIRCNSDIIKDKEKSRLYVKMVDSYSGELDGFFTKVNMQALGLVDVLTRDGIIEKPYGSAIMDNSTQPSSVLLGSLLVSDNGSFGGPSYSSYDAGYTASIM